jgi:hypothetical protein
VGHHLRAPDCTFAALVLLGCRLVLPILERRERLQLASVLHVAAGLLSQSCYGVLSNSAEGGGAANVAVTV